MDFISFNNRIIKKFFSSKIRHDISEDRSFDIILTLDVITNPLIL